MPILILMGQTAQEMSQSIVPWITIFIALANAAFFYLAWKFRKEYPSMEVFIDLKNEVEGIPGMIEKTDFSSRTAQQKEVLRMFETFEAKLVALQNSFDKSDDRADRRAEELRRLIGDLDKVVQHLKEQVQMIDKDFALLKQSTDIELENMKGVLIDRRRHLDERESA